MSLGLALRVVGKALETALDGSVDRTADGVTTLMCVTSLGEMYDRVIEKYFLFKNKI